MRTFIMQYDALEDDFTAVEDAAGDWVPIEDVQDILDELAIVNARLAELEDTLARNGIKEPGYETE